MRHNSIKLTSNNIESSLEKAKFIIKNGGVVVYPTDTFYAIGANPFNSAAVDKVFTVKGRNFNKPLGVIASTFLDLCKLSTLTTLPAHIKQITDIFWPGPLSIVLPASKNLPDKLCAGGNNIAIRIPDCEFAIKLTNFIGLPLTSTSANLSGGKDPATIDEIPLELRNAVDLILDNGKTPGGEVSTIIKFEDEKAVLIRKGAIDFKRIIEGN